MKKIRFPVLLLTACLALTLFAPPAAALDAPDVECGYCVLLETNTDTVFYERGANERAYPASLTKIMTVLLAVEDIENQTVLPDGTVVSPDCTVTASDTFGFDMIADGSTESILPGETMTLEDLLFCAMLSSANEACNIIAEYLSGSVSAFVERMNQRATELGCTGTHFANTHGLPNEDHYTTAWDLTLIAREAITHPLFRELCGTQTRTIHPTNLSAERELSNSNSLININVHYPGDYLYEGAAGIKTGFTAAAGYCLAAVATREGLSNFQLLSIVLRAPAYDDNGDGTLDRYCNFTDTASLFDWGFDNWSYREVVKSTDIITEVPVSLGDGTDTVAVRPSTSIVRLLPNDDDLSSYQKVPTIYAQENNEQLTAPISAGQVLGEISIVKDGRVIGTASLVASTEVNLSRVRFMRTQVSATLKLPIVRWTFWTLVVLMLFYIFIVARYRRRRRLYTDKLEQVRVAQAIAESDDEVREWYNTGEERSKVYKTPPQRDESVQESKLAKEAQEMRESVADEQGFRDYFEEFYGQDDKKDDPS